MMYYQRLKDLREEEGLNQEDIAKILQTTQQYYSQYERGVREIPVHHLITLAKLYKTTLDYLVGLTNQRDK